MRGNYRSAGAASLIQIRPSAARLAPFLLAQLLAPRLGGAEQHPVRRLLGRFRRERISDPARADDDHVAFLGVDVGGYVMGLAGHGSRTTGLPRRSQLSDEMPPAPEELRP